MAAGVVDTVYLSTFLNVPEQTLSSVVDAPTAELVRSILDAVYTKAREHDELIADKVRADIELENAVRSAETRIEGLRSTVEKTQKIVEEVRTKLKEEENARSSLESELQHLKSSSTSSTSEVETLRSRIASLEAANRDTVAIVESKTTANDELSKDLQKQHQKGLELAQQITTLQQTVQNATSSASSAKFREQSLSQELELSKRNNEWFENELKTKSAEALKYRKEKGARIAELQRLNEEANSNLEALKRTEQALRNRLDEVQKKAEDSLSKVQQLQEAAAQAEEGFRQELESARRLAELQSEQTKTHRDRLREVEASLEKAKDEAADEKSRVEQELHAERQDREQGEHRIAELEAEVDRLEALVSAPRQSSVPGTPRQGLNGSMFGRSGSPAYFGTPGSVRSKTAITATQAIEELYKVKGQLSTEKRERERLESALDEMMQSLEAKQPEIEELQNEHDRLQQEVVEMSKYVDQTGKERDRAKKDARKAENEASTAQAEGRILKQQLHDLSAQIKMLLYDQVAREGGLDALSSEQRAQLDGLARGEVSEEALEGLTDTDRFISQRLTIFRNVSELQEKNQELLKITRQLADKMESEEALAARKNEAEKDQEDVQALLAKIENYKDELQSMITRSESYIKERDMFRRMLQHRGQLPPAADLASVFGQSVDGHQNGLLQTTEHAQVDYAAPLRELQALFDQYKEEQGIDRRTMKEQSEKLALEKGSLQTELAKVNSQYTHVSERLELLHSNYAMIQNENAELQKRSQILSEASAKQDLRTQQVAEDLVEAKGLVESMRNENANLKAEKKLWKDIQDRLSQDNENLMNERSRLNNLVANQQTLQNERELSDSETRRRLQGQVETLEAELSTTKRKLSDEVEDNKKAQLRKEYDSQQTQKRIDDLASSLGQAREELVAAKTTRDHLQSRVDEMTIELKSAEERVELLQPRPTPRPGTQGQVNGDVLEAEVTHEQELAVEVSELKRDLELAKSELESTKSQTEQYKSISQSTEEELQSLNATHDEYREEMDRIIEEKDVKIRDLEQRVEDISAELTNTNNELTTLRNSQADVARQGEEEKAILEAEIARLKDEDERHSTAAQFHQQDLRAQAAIATKAQQDYENELVKHAEAAKLLQNLRGEHNQLKTEAASLRADAESARVALSQSESSWEERREHFEQEIKDLRTRRDDLNAQNKVLHQQLDNVGAQISALQQSRSSAIDASGIDSPAPEATQDRNADGLRELNAYLRREKEIVEVQYELKTQEAKRLQQQLDYAQSQLDESRLKLDQERRHQADGSRSSVAHKDLMEKLNELNLFRESSITLRNEARQAQAQVTEKTKRVEELLEQIQPLETKIRELEHSKETMDGEMRLLQEDRDRWQKRTQDIISKYDRIDPAEMEQLKENLEALRSERDALIEEKQPVQEKIQALEQEKAGWQQSRQRLIDQAKERNRIQAKENKDRTTERDAAIQEKEALQSQLSGLQEELDAAVREKEAAEQQLTALSQELELVALERDRAATAAAQSTTQPSTIQSVAALDTIAIDQQLSEMRAELDRAKQDKQALEAQIKGLRDQLQKANTERDAAVADAAEARASKQASDIGNGNDNEDGQIHESLATGLSEEERKSLEERIITAEAKAKEQEEKASRIEEQMEVTLKTRSDKMKAALNKRLADSKETQKADLEAEYALRFEQDKKIWLAENKSIPAPITISTEQPKQSIEAPPATPGAPSTPGQNHNTSSPAASNLPNLSEEQVRKLLQSNAVLQNIMRGNILKKVQLETQKLKEEHEKAYNEAKEKAESAQKQAVMMESKKSALRINMSENKVKTATGKLEIVEKAAEETPQRPVIEVWEIVKVYKPPPPAAASAVSIPAPAGTITPAAAPVAAKPNGIASTASTSTEVKADDPMSPAPSQVVNASSTPNGTPSGPSHAPNGPLQNNNAQRVSSLPQPASSLPQPSSMRGGAQMRGRGGNQIYQPRGGSQGIAQGGRGRGGIPRGGGGMNPGAPMFNPTGPAGMKRARDEGATGPQQGNGGKRPRGG